MKKFSLIALLCCIACLYYSQTSSPPAFQWVDKLAGNCQPYSVKTDSQGNIYITGEFSGITDFDPGAATYTMSATNVYNSFVVKLNSSGNFIWARQFVSPSHNTGSSICIDNQQQILVTGYFYGSADFNPGSSVFNLVPVGNSDVFVVKLDTSGNFIWAKSIGGNDNDLSKTIKTDATGNLYIMGQFSSTMDFDPGPGTFTMTTSSQKGFLVKLNSSANFLWATEIGLGGYLRPMDFDFDGSNNIYTTGFFQGGIDVDPTSSVDTVLSIGGFDAYVIKLNNGGNFLWIKILTDSFNTKGAVICTDGNGDVYTSGVFISKIDLDPGVAMYTVTPAGQGMYFLKLDGQGNFISAKNFNSGGIYSINLERNSSNNFLLSGTFDNSVTIGPGNSVLNSNGNSDVFLSKLDAGGNSIWAQSWGGKQNDWNYGHCSDGGSNIYTIGSFQDTVDMDPGPGNFTVSSASGTAFVHKLMECCVAIEDHVVDNDIVTFFPNPTAGKLYVNLKVNEDIKIKVYDVSGRLLESKDLNSSTNELSLEHYAAGIYFIEALAAAKKKTYKIIKQ